MKLTIPKITRSMLWTRGALYVGIAVLQKLYEILTSSAPINWRVSIVAMLIAGGLTLRVYLDETSANHKRGESEESEDEIPTGSRTLPNIAANLPPTTGDTQTL